VRVRLAGKIATVLQIAAVLWILLGWNAAAMPYLATAAAAFTVAATLLYILDGVKQLNSHPNSAAAQD
jgi:phosphatidylglycerophosphate synthase